MNVPFPPIGLEKARSSRFLKDFSWICARALLRFGASLRPDFPLPVQSCGIFGTPWFPSVFNVVFLSTLRSFSNPLLAIFRLNPRARPVPPPACSLEGAVTSSHGNRCGTSASLQPLGMDEFQLAGVVVRVDCFDEPAFPPIGLEKARSSRFLKDCSWVCARALLRFGASLRPIFLCRSKAAAFLARHGSRLFSMLFFSPPLRSFSNPWLVMRQSRAGCRSGRERLFLRYRLTVWFAEFPRTRFGSRW